MEHGSGHEEIPAPGDDVDSIGSMSIAVIALGSDLFGDEGLAVAASRVIAAMGFAGVEVIDPPPDGDLTGRDALLVLEAVPGRNSHPGEIVELRPEDLRDASRTGCRVAQALSDALAEADALGKGPGCIAGLAMTAEDLEEGCGLTAVVYTRMPEMVGRALEILERWGAIPTRALNQS
ncbi:hypothetical protein HQ535_01435 [bacterium]|nr:hypothetical protein [bacterium]